MKVSEALQIIQKPRPEAAPFHALLACGCATLHLKTFLQAHLQQRLTRQQANVSEGLYGDLAGTVERSADRRLHAAAVVLEWSDLDSRLGFRSAGRWSLSAIDDILKNTAVALDRIGAAIGNLPTSTRVALSLPGLPLPPMFHTAGTQSAAAELELERLLAGFAADMARRSGLAVVNARRLAEVSAPGDRFDLKSDLLIGFPYTIAHADALASACADLLVPASPKKGIITDLDDTLWNGIAGEVGAEGVSWDLGSHHHMHALYQNLLASLAEQGVLIAVASKNDPAVVKSAFERPDLLLPADRVFPFQVHWQAKSGSVKRILETWNIAADSVIFVDDSPLELAEVEAAHPGIHCVPFPRSDYRAGLAMLRSIRQLCGKERITGEDTLRLDSIRQGAEFRKAAEDAAASDAFLSQAGSVVTFDFNPSPEDGRTLDLVNKTNQFNLNGIRYTEADWAANLARDGAFVAVVSYEDKFGPLGKIAVLQGFVTGEIDQRVVHVTTWVMSCRAFSRRIEFQCLKTLFERFDARELTFSFIPTPKNGPLQEFLRGAFGDAAGPPWTLNRPRYELSCPPLYHSVPVAA